MTRKRQCTRLFMVSLTGVGCRFLSLAAKRDQASARPAAVQGTAHARTAHVPSRNVFIVFTWASV
jgi:hypothetical protein